MRNIKYYGKKNLAFYVGELFSSGAPEPVFSGADIITPVPLHWARKQKRGYNQAEWLSRGIVSQMGNIELCTDILIRKKHTRTQVKLDKSERWKNVKGAFVIAEGKGEIIRGKSVILVDDIITTGATTASCTEALLKAGAKSVKVVSLGRD